jgi:hypothetical protein
VPVLVREDWSEAEFRAYTIADNQWTKRASYDFALLREELVDLDTGEFDLTLTGFTDGDIERLMTVDEAAAETVEDIRPISYVHVMLSFSVDKMSAFASLLEQAKAIGAEIEQSHT